MSSIIIAIWCFLCAGLYLYEYFTTVFVEAKTHHLIMAIMGIILGVGNLLEF